MCHFFSFSQSETFQKGMIEDLKFNENIVRAKIKGNFKPHYETGIKFTKACAKPTCNCPLDEPWCKHAIALGFASLKNHFWEEYLYEKLKLSSIYEEEILQVQSRFEQDKKNYSVRGKWALGFMVEVLEFIMDNAQKYVPSLYRGETNGPKRMCQLTEGGTMVMLAPRIQPVSSLETFLESNINCA